MKARLPDAYRGGSGNMNNMIKQAQKMQEDIAKVQTELEGQVYTVASGGGAVEVTITGKREVQGITIRPDAVDPEDVEMLQDLLVAAVNEAIRRVDETSAKEMEKVTGGMNMPGLL